MIEYNKAAKYAMQRALEIGDNDLLLAVKTMMDTVSLLQQRSEADNARLRSELVSLTKYKAVSMNESDGPYALQYPGNDPVCMYDPDHDPFEAYELFAEWLAERARTALAQSFATATAPEGVTERLEALAAKWDELGSKFADDDNIALSTMQGTLIGCANDLRAAVAEMRGAGKNDNDS